VDNVTAAAPISDALRRMMANIVPAARLT